MTAARLPAQRSLPDGPLLEFAEQGSFRGAMLLMLQGVTDARCSVGLQGLGRALCSAAVGSLAGLVGGVLICAAAALLSGCGAVWAPAVARAAVPLAASSASDIKATQEEVCDLRARLCR